MGDDFVSWAFSVVRAPSEGVQVLDDVPEGNQNDTAEVQFTRVPATLQSLAAITRAMAGRFPISTLQEIPSDVASTYRQATADLGQVHLCAVATWSNSNQCVVSRLAVTQLLHNKSASLITCLAATTIA